MVLTSVKASTWSRRSWRNRWGRNSRRWGSNIFRRSKLSFFNLPQVWFPIGSTTTTTIQSLHEKTRRYLLLMLIPFQCDQMVWNFAKRANLITMSHKPKPKKDRRARLSWTLICFLCLCNVCCSLKNVFSNHHHKSIKELCLRHKNRGFIILVATDWGQLQTLKLEFDFVLWNVFYQEAAYRFRFQLWSIL